MLCKLHCLKARLRLLCNENERHSSLNFVSQQLKLCNIFIFGIANYSPEFPVASMGFSNVMSKKMVGKIDLWYKIKKASPTINKKSECHGDVDVCITQF